MMLPSLLLIAFPRHPLPPALQRSTSKMFLMFLMFLMLASLLLIASSALQLSRDPLPRRNFRRPVCWESQPRKEEDVYITELFSSLDPPTYIYGEVLRAGQGKSPKDVHIPGRPHCVHLGRGAPQLLCLSDLQVTTKRL